jgi:hypothetical protein
MEILAGKDGYKVVSFNALQSTVASQSFAGTPREIASSQISWYGYFVNNNDASVRWVQIFLKPLSQVILGTTSPDISFPVPASGGVQTTFEHPIRLGTGFTIACTTTEIGSTGATIGATGSFLFGKIPTN